MSALDFDLALRLQREFENENRSASKGKENKTSLVDPSWELVDPTPDIYLLFRLFNEKYFWNKLLAVCVDWSKRMTTCAGICSYQRYGGMCKITLSEPLLKLRPRKDLVETLLHEMIHAYLFVTNNNKDRDGHGPEFHKHMRRINQEAGTNITVYHDFHDEVRLYKQHWWRCNGPCQHRKPFFGMVRRATNRAPGPYDRWFAEHLASCGGTFIKVKEPEKPQKATATKKAKKDTNSKDIRSFYSPVLTSNGAVPKVSNPVIPKVSKPAVPKISNPVIPKVSNAAVPKISNGAVPMVSNGTSYTTPSNGNIKTITDVKTEGGGCDTARPSLKELPIPFTGQGHVLSTAKSANSNANTAVRDHWANKFVPIKRPTRPTSETSAKKQKVTPECPVCQQPVEGDLNVHLDTCLMQNQTTTELKTCEVCDEEVDSRNFDCHLAQCLQNIFNKEGVDEDEVVVLAETIPCLVCSRQIDKEELNSHLDECLNDQVFKGKKSEEVVELPASDIKYNCPVCFEMYSADQMGVHLDQCVSSNSNDNIVNEMLEENLNFS